VKAYLYLAFRNREHLSFPPRRTLYTLHDWPTGRHHGTQFSAPTLTADPPVCLPVSYTTISSWNSQQPKPQNTQQTKRGMREGSRRREEEWISDGTIDGRKDMGRLLEVCEARFVSPW
jgi:hypothetical protein